MSIWGAIDRRVVVLLGKEDNDAVKLRENWWDLLLTQVNQSLNILCD